MMYFIYAVGVESALLWPLEGFFALLPVAVGGFCTWLITWVASNAK